MEFSEDFYTNRQTEFQILLEYAIKPSKLKFGNVKNLQLGFDTAKKMDYGKNFIKTLHRSKMRPSVEICYLWVKSTLKRQKNKNTVKKVDKCKEF